jgi:TonB-linked SusC/RagA family outer membrane protein
MKLFKLLTVLLMFCSCVGLAGQTKGNTGNNTPRKISGTITDEGGQSVIGANIIIKGTKQGTITDVNGSFVITATPHDKLLITCIGYDGTEVAVNDRQTLSIVMRESSKALNEVVVVGYGSVKKSNLTTAVSKVGEEALAQRPFTTLSEAFSGQIAGAQSQVSSGVPGDDMQITIRGTNSMNSASSPLYVIDGVISETMNDVNPGDVASIQVLKDAAATSIYGARGSNGVILIETKKAKGNAPTITFESSYGIQQSDRLPQVMSPKEWFAYNIWWINANYLSKGGLNSMSIPNKLRPTADQIPEAWLLNPQSDNPDWRLNPNVAQTNWVNAILKTAPVQNYQLSASGKSNVGSIYVSGGYTNQEGIVKFTGFERINFRLNGTLNLSKNLTAGLSAAPSVSTQNSGQAQGKDNAIINAMQYPPLMSMNSGTRDLGFDPNYPNYVNPYWQLASVTAKTAINRTNVSAWLEYKIVPELVFKTIYNNNTRNTVYEYFIPGNVVAPNAAGGQVSSGNSYSETYSNWGIQNTLSFDKTFGKHNVSIMAGQSADNTSTYRATVAATGFPLENVTTLNVATTPTTAQTIRYLVRTASFFGRASYNFEDRYLLTTSVRYDGSTRFGPSNRWGMFPSVSGGWKISEEPLLKANKQFADLVTLLKLRASWGLAGNDQIGYNDYLSTFSVTNAVYGGQAQAGMYPNNFANPDLKWESTESKDFGLDLSMVKNRIQFNFDYYINTTKSMLYNLQIPATTGFSTMRTNLASLRNYGWEAELTTVNVSRKNFQWSTTLNLSHNQNKVLYLGGNDNLITQAWNSYFITQVGGPVSQFYVFKTDGLLTRNDFGVGPDGNYDKSHPLVPVMSGQIPGNVKFVDTNHDGAITDADRVACGNNVPDLLFGFTNHFTYKGFELTVFLQGQLGGDVYYLATRNINYGKRQNNMLVGWLRCYKDTYKGGDPIPYELGVDMSWDGKTPNPWGIGANGVNENTGTDRWIYDASYLRIKNVNLSYLLPPSIVRKLHVRQVRVYTSIENLYTFTKYMGNPDVNSYAPNNPMVKGVDYSTYPLTKKYTVGLNVTF